MRHSHATKKKEQAEGKKKISTFLSLGKHAQHSDFVYLIPFLALNNLFACDDSHWQTLVYERHSCMIGCLSRPPLWSRLTNAKPPVYASNTWLRLADTLAASGRVKQTYAPRNGGRGRDERGRQNPDLWLERLVGRPQASSLLSLHCTRRKRSNARAERRAPAFRALTRSTSAVVCRSLHH